MMLDPKLGEHLAHFGIDIMSMKQTEKTMTELEIDLNQRVCIPRYSIHSTEHRVLTCLCPVSFPVFLTLCTVYSLYPPLYFLTPISCIHPCIT